MHNLRTITLNYMSFVSIMIGVVVFFCNSVTHVYERHKNGLYDRTLLSNAFFYVIYESDAHSENLRFLWKSNVFT